MDLIERGGRAEIDGPPASDSDLRYERVLSLIGATKTTMKYALMFKTLLAYIIVVALGQFAFTFGMLLGSGLFGAVCYYLPLKIKSVIAGVLAGILATTAVMGFAYGIFVLLTGNWVTGK